MRYTLLFLLWPALFLAGCGASADTPPVGSDVAICLRRDALGAPTDRWLDASTISVAGADIAFSGKFIEATDQWIVLDTQPQANRSSPLRVWIPRAAVLAVFQRRQVQE